MRLIVWSIHFAFDSLNFGHGEVVLCHSTLLRLVFRPYSNFDTSNNTVQKRGIFSNCSHNLKIKILPFFNYQSSGYLNEKPDEINQFSRTMKMQRSEPRNSHFGVLKPRNVPNSAFLQKDSALAHRQELPWNLILLKLQHSVYIHAKDKPSETYGLVNHENLLGKLERLVDTKY